MLRGCRLLLLYLFGGHIFAVFSVGADHLSRAVSFDTSASSFSRRKIAGANGAFSDANSLDTTVKAKAKLRHAESEVSHRNTRYRKLLRLLINLRPFERLLFRVRYVVTSFDW